VSGTRLMAVDLEPFLAAPGGGGSGEDLDGDAAFAALERALVGKPERQVGNTITPAEPPDWAFVEATATELLRRSSDLRLAAALFAAWTSRHGVAGCMDGLALVRGLLERSWAALYPQLDADNPSDAQARASALASLYEPRLLATLRGAPLVRSRSFGPITWRNLDRTGGASALDSASLDAAFAEVPQEEIIATAESLRMSLSHVAAIEGAFATVASGPDLAPLTLLLRSILNGVQPRIQAQIAPPSENSPARVEGQPASPSAPATALRGELRSRDDVLRAIEAICNYYSTHEPSSPLPLLLRRCKRLVTMTFAEIIQDMVPDALPQVRVIAGKSEE
jgi:type VI secretion system protein ImpA